MRYSSCSTRAGADEETAEGIADALGLCFSDSLNRSTTPIGHARLRACELARILLNQTSSATFGSAHYQGAPEARAVRWWRWRLPCATESTFLRLQPSWDDTICARQLCASDHPGDCLLWGSCGEVATLFQRVPAVVSG